MSPSFAFSQRPIRLACGPHGDGGLRALCAGLAAGILATAGPLHAAQSALKGPYVTALSDSEATVRFELETAAPAAIEVTALAGASGDASAAKPGRFESREVSSMHSVRVSGLQAATQYAYVVRAGSAVVADGRIVTAPRPDANAPLTFTVYGDDRSDEAAHTSIVRAMMALPSDFLVNTGDMVEDGGNASNWQAFFDIEKPLLHERALLSAIGNHELYDDAAGANFARYFGFPEANGAVRPYGTARLGNARFFFLNGMDDWSSGEERQWLERELSRADAEAGLAWRFAVVHHGPWSSGPHGPNAKLIEAGVPRLLALHKVDLVLSGHDHIYERGDAGILKYLVSGGGGAPLYRDLHRTETTRKAEPTHHFIEVTIRGNALQMVALRSDGSVLDRCGFTQGGPWDCDAPRAATAPSAPVPPSAPPPGGGCACSGAGAGSYEGGAVAAFAALAAVSFVRSRRRS